MATEVLVCVCYIDYADIPSFDWVGIDNFFESEDVGTKKSLCLSSSQLSWTNTVFLINFNQF